MKTAMQELMQWMEETEFMVNSAFIDKVNECLGKEKEQMIDFYNWMRRNDSSEEYFHYSDEDMLTEYLNQNQYETKG